MRKSYLHLFLTLFMMAAFAGCLKEESLLTDGAARANGVPVELDIDIVCEPGTRGILSESKREFNDKELVHIRAEFLCDESEEGSDIKKYRKDVVYTILQCTSSSYLDNRYYVRWATYSGQPDLIWPNDAVSGTFTAYYISGSNGALSGNPMPAKLLSDYKASEVPLSAEVKDVAYGEAVRLPMKRLFSFLTLTEMQEGISNDMWFSLPENSDGGVKLNNAFQLLFDTDSKTMIPTFSQIASEDYKDSNGNPLVFVKTYNRDEESEEDGSASGISFFLEPKVYHQFSILYPRTRDTYVTYLNYTGDLAKVIRNEDQSNTEGAFMPNGRYVFSILKSLGVIVDETPDDGWDKGEPTVIVDVEAFLKAAESGSDYYEKDDITEEEVQILESTSEGTRLLRNVCFNHYYYDVFPDNFRPSLHNTFDGDYHYICDMACPLFYENYGNIVNLGIRNAKTNADEPIVSCEKADRNGQTVDMSYNGIIACRNMGMVDNVRVIDVDMTVKIRTTNGNTQEAHNVSLLFGANQGRVYDVGLAGELKLTVENDNGVTVMPKVMTGGVAGQNTGTIRGISYIDDENEAFDMPAITITNKCVGDNGVYWFGGIAGNNTGSLDNIFMPSVDIDSSQSRGLGSYLGGMTGECPSSTSGASSISDCIVRGSIEAGEIRSITNLESYSYSGGVSGSLNLQAYVSNSSVSVAVTDRSTPDSAVMYGVGGAFGIIQPLDRGILEGEISILSCYGTALTGNGYKGNFAGIVPGGYGWSHYEDNQINLKQHSGTGNIGLERN